jgi:hypothetical protein
MYWSYVIGGYGFVAIGLALYTGYLMRQGRVLSKKLPAERRRFLD